MVLRVKYIQRIMGVSAYWGVAIAVFCRVLGASCVEDWFKSVRFVIRLTSLLIEILVEYGISSIPSGKPR